MSRSVEQHLARDAGAADGLVHAVQRAKEGALPASARPDERQNLVFEDVDGHVVNGDRIAVVDAPDFSVRIFTARFPGDSRGCVASDTHGAWSA